VQKIIEILFGLLELKIAILRCFLRKKGLCPLGVKKRNGFCTNPKLFKSFNTFNINYKNYITFGF
jgi:hypothetical protein